MLFLNMATSLTGEEKEKIRKEVKERTGEDCCILPPQGGDGEKRALLPFVLMEESSGDFTKACQCRCGSSERPTR